eukprot:c23353_g1_i2 orf=461-1639(+)
MQELPYISGLNFDSKGFYLASVSSAGCLAVHDYETIYCRAEVSNATTVKPIVHIATNLKLEAICWNPTNQDEVACVAAGGRKVYCYDIACMSYNPVEILKMKTSTARELNTDPSGLFDVTFCNMSANKVLACGEDGNVHVWDRRANPQYQSLLSAPKSGTSLSSLQISTDEQVIYAGSDRGLIYAWDLRGGTQSVAFLIPGKDYHPPFATFNLALLLEQISSLREQTDITISAVHSIRLNPSCGRQLAFHLNNGWSGVLDLSELGLTHIHCPPPPWLGGSSACSPICQRKPAWLPTHSVYVSGSCADLKIHFLDFKPSPNSLCYAQVSRNGQSRPRNELLVSEPVIVCAAHPMTNHLIVGTEVGTLQLIAHKSFSKMDDSSFDDNVIDSSTP